MPLIFSEPFMHKKIASFIQIISLCLLSLFAQADELKLTSGIMMPEATTIQPFTLEAQQADAAGKIFTQNNLQNHWTLIFFGFTNCPMLCPTTMATLANAYTKLQTQGFKPLPQVIFVSVDSQRDTLEKTHIFATTFHKNFIGARTDDQRTLLRMTHEMHTMFEKVPLPAGTTQDKDATANYTIDHTGDIMVINPQGQFVAMLTMPHTAENIVADYQTIVNHATAPSGFFAKMKALL